MKLNSLHDLFLEELRDLYHAENQILKALPKMAKSATRPELQMAFQEHLQQTEQQVHRLEQIFEKLGMPTRGKKCKAMEGIIEEGKEVMKKADSSVMDAALIGAAQKVEHYEIAGYGCARTYAQQLGDHEAADLLQQTLDEEEATDRKLTEIAESTANVEAASA